MIDDLIPDAKERMEKSVQHTRDEMARIRTGKATPTLLESIKVEYYAIQTKHRYLPLRNKKIMGFSRWYVLFSGKFTEM